MQYVALIFFIIFVYVGSRYHDAELQNEQYTSNAEYVSESNDTFKTAKFSRNSQWKEEDWYKAKDGDGFNHYLGWYRHVAYIESDNVMLRCSLFGNPCYPRLSIESYTKELGKKKRIERIMFLTILGLRKDINSVVMRFDNDSPEKFNTTRKHNIEIHFSNNDISKIIDRLKKASTFAIKVDGVVLYYDNKNFLKVLPK